MRSALKELEQHKYLVRRRTKNELGQFEYAYIVYEVPYTENQHTGNQKAQKQSAEKRRQISKEEKNKELLNKDILKKEEELRELKKFYGI